MSESIKVSIVVPIFNGENYIKTCLKNIFSQTYKNTEIIIVNDGSTDSTLNILEEFKSDNPQLIIINCENAGAPSARNKGIEAANGEYLTFVDCDDIITKDYIKNLVEAANGADIVISGYETVTDQNKSISKRIITDKKLSFYSNVATCSKLYRTAFIKENNIRYLENATLFEDAYFFLNAYFTAEKAVTVPFTDYHIVSNGNSLSHKAMNSENTANEIVKTFSMIKSSVKTDKTEIFEYFFYRTAIYFMLFYCKNKDCRLINSAYDTVFGWIDENLKKKNKYLSAFDFSGEVFSVKLIIVLFDFFRKIRIAKPFLRIFSKIQVKK